MEKSWMIFTLRDFDPSLFLVHVGANDLSWKDTQEVMTDRIIKTVEFLIREKKNNVVVFNIAPRGNICSDKAKEFNEIL